MYMEQVPPMCTKLQSSLPADILEACIFFRKLLAIDKVAPIHLVVQYDVLPLLLTHYVTGSVTIQNEIAWTMTNIACGDASQIRYLCTARSLPTATHPQCHNLLSAMYHTLLRYQGMLSTNGQMELLIEHVLWILGKFV